MLLMLVMCHQPIIHEGIADLLHLGGIIFLVVEQRGASPA